MPKVDPLDLTGRLDLTIDGIACAVFFEHDLIVLAPADLSVALALRKKLPQAMKAYRDMTPWLKHAGLEIVITVKGHRVGRFTPGVAPNRLAKLFQADPFRIEARGLLKALLRPNKDLSR